MRAHLHHDIDAGSAASPPARSDAHSPLRHDTGTTTDASLPSFPSPDTTLPCAALPRFATLATATACTHAILDAHSLPRAPLPPHRAAVASRVPSSPSRLLHRDRDTTALRRTALRSCLLARLLARHSARPPSSPSTTRASLDHRHSTTVLALARDTTARPRRHSSLLRHHRPRAPHHGTPSTGPFLDHATPDHDHGPTPRHEHPSRHEHSSDTRRPTIALLEPHDHDAQAARPRPAAAAAFAAARSMPGCAHDHRPRSRSRLGPHTSLHSLAHSLATLPA